MQEPLISVIVPVYKVEAYLERCVDSLRNQTYRNLEIILVDDGSPDSCGEMCDELAAQDSRIRVVHKENGGLSSARNAGLDCMTGEYVGFVDSDDWVKPEMYECLYRLMQENDAQIACCGIARCDGTCVKSYFNDNLEDEFTLDTLGALCELTYNYRITNSVCDKLYQVDIFCGLRMKTGMLYEDAQIQPYCISRARRICYTAKPMYRYFLSPNSILRGDFSLRHYDNILTSQERQALYAARYPQALPYAKAAHVVLCMTMVYESRNSKAWDKLRRELVQVVRQPMDREAALKLRRGSRVKRLALCVSPKLFIFLITLRDKLRKPAAETA